MCAEAVKFSKRAKRRPSLPLSYLIFLARVEIIIPRVLQSIYDFLDKMVNVFLKRFHFYLLRWKNFQNCLSLQLKQINSLFYYN